MVTPLNMKHEGPFLLKLLVLALLIFSLYSLAFPLHPGRDFGGYLEHFYGKVAANTLFRPVGASYLLGMISNLPLLLAEVAFLLMYLCHIFMVYITSRIFGVQVARIVTLLMLFDFSVLAIFHRLDGYAAFCLASLS